ncbi:hypothetical protein PC129_g7983 [Phytophthora cactorum]|uniref:RWP-RK domain-containing protein n=3 Tax=Phytophthora cactorum TaxID=29920 RepID=A0A329S3J2_9STRA|nr:hypothetical protein Pcac1_g23848 [Phytophthora cactorum]KAG2839095.1 hypothetical protein PC111_g3977 [Phytophthora cactorum]KAG2848452.1 hypothetical protein PC112_g713 [Phytophthora cactorum]KAG2868657.1 hypothetical protein PC113_g900 [Phytophthora cactorum]KAG2907553.1 hypothetical protein PC114_g10783 [Phytophthora cactorum]
MAAEMEQHRAPELAVTESGPRVAPSVSSSMMKPPYTMDENKPVAPTDVSKSGLTWPDPSLQPLRTKPTTPGGSSLKVETSPTIVHTNSTGATLDESGLPKPSDGLPVPSMSCDSVSPVSPTVMKDLQFDSRFISDAWSYEAPQNMYALLTQPTNQMDPLAGGTGLVTPYMQLQAQQQHLQMQQQQLEQQLEHGLPLQMSPIHGSGLSSLYMSGAPMAISPHQMMMQPPNAPGMNPGYPSTPTAVTLSDIMISGDPSMFLAPSGSPTNMVKQQMMPPMPHAGGVINVKDLTLNELRPHFNKPMAVVAKELGVCITLMKKICRRNGLVRWPHRRIRSLVNRITSLQVLASNAAGAERKRFQGQIAGLREELSAVIQNPNEKSRKAQTDTKIPSKTEEMILREVSNEFPIAQITDEMVGPAEIPVDDESNDNDIHQTGTGAAKKSKKKKLTTPKTETKEVVGVKCHAVVEKEKTDEVPRTKKRKPSFGLHAHQPPPIKIPRHDELPSMSRLRSQSVPERRLRGDRRYGRGRDKGASASSTSVRPSTTTHRNGRRGSISSILNDIPE